MAERESLRPVSPSYGSTLLTGSTAFSVSVDVDPHNERGGSGVNISFHDVSYEVSSWCGRKRKVILNSASGLLSCGLNVIMGPTGSGKTTLLDILAGRKNKSGLSGTVLVNGDRQPNNFKCISGYVVQNDVVMGTLSVRENLHFSAALRLPSWMTHAERKERVERVIDELGLRECASTKVGTEFLRGISGGERKRTNIGMELIIQPEVLFLDEATSGLDAYTAVSVVQLLKRLSKTSDRIIVMSIHQPRYSIFKLFDTLTLLSEGTVVYHGPNSKALEYFGQYGFHCEQYENPADYFLDVISSCENRANTVNQGDEEGKDGNTVKAVDLVQCYEQSEQHRVVQIQLQPILDHLFEREQAGGTLKHQKRIITYPTNFLWQLLVVSIRSMVNLLRNPRTSVFQVLVMIVFALLVGILYLRINERDLNTFNLQNAFIDRIGALFFVALCMAFGNMSAVDLFINNTVLFIHENGSGFYRVSSYFLAVVITDLIPTRIIPLCVFTLIAYFMVGFQLEAEKFFIFFLTVTQTSISAACLVFAIGSRVNSSGVASLLIAMAFVIQMLFGGFLVASDSLPVWLSWIKYVSIIHYSVEALSINEVAGQNYTVTSSNSTIICPSDNCIIGTEELQRRGFETSMDWLWYNQIALAGISLLFLALTYINLRMVKKEK